MGRAIFQLIYFIDLAAISLIRSNATSKFRRQETNRNHKTRFDLSLFALSVTGMILPLFYLFSSWLDFANYTLPDWSGWIGVVLFTSATVLLWITHRALGSSWAPTLSLRENHQLVTDGIFQFIRHPMYTAYLLWAVAQPLLLQNWIAGFSFLVVALPQYLLRVSAEEELLLNTFGEEYQDYMEQTGRIFPRKFPGE